MTSFGRLRFHPRPVPTLLLALLVPACLGLAWWQVERGRDKEADQALLEARLAAPAITVPAQPADARTLALRRVAARGRYEAERQFLLDNRVFRGQAGYHVITPLHLEGSELRLLVDRGWIAGGGDRRILPEVAVPAGVVSVEGIAVVPGPAYRLAPAEAGWTPVWQALDLDRYRALAGVPVQPVVVVEFDAGGPGSPGRLERERPQPASGAGRHFAYAAQWIVIALAGMGLWLRHAALERRSGSGAP